MNFTTYKMATACLVFTLFMGAQAMADGPPANALHPERASEWFEIDPREVYPDFEYRGLTPSCADGPARMENGKEVPSDAKFTFFSKRGRMNRLLVYFEGGGACWDTTNCIYQSTYSEETPSIKDFHHLGGRGILDTYDERNPFKDWHFIYIPYCTGDIHWGSNDQVYEDEGERFAGVDSWAIRHRGFVNFRGVLKWITDAFKDPQKVFVTGSSAGSYGAVLGFPYLKEAYPAAKATLLGDAGDGVVTEEFKAGALKRWGVQGNFPAWIPGFHRSLGEFTMADMYERIAEYYPGSRVGRYTTAWDWNQVFFYTVMLHVDDPSRWGEWRAPEIWCSWRRQMLASVRGAAEKPNYRYYIGAGKGHTILTSPSFYTEESGGILFSDWVRAMLEDDSWENAECKECGEYVDCGRKHRGQ
jgi:hypothetical protein